MSKRAIELKKYFLREINPIIRFLILSDVLILGALGLLAPVFAFFIEGFIDGGNAAVAGISAAIFLATKSIAQIPLAHTIDRIRGEKDDFWFLVISSMVTALIPLCYLLINTPGELYFVQFIYGLSTAITTPSFMTIFTKNIDNGKEGVEWGIYYTLADLVGAGMAGLGGFLATTYGYNVLIIVVSMCMFSGSLLLFPIRPYIKNKRKIT